MEKGKDICSPLLVKTILEILASVISEEKIKINKMETKSKTIFISDNQAYKNSKESIEKATGTNEWIKQDHKIQDQ